MFGKLVSRVIKVAAPIMATIASRTAFQETKEVTDERGGSFSWQQMDVKAHGLNPEDLTGLNFDESVNYTAKRYILNPEVPVSSKKIILNILKALQAKLDADNSPEYDQFMIEQIISVALKTNLDPERIVNAPCMQSKLLIGEVNGVVPETTEGARLVFEMLENMKYLQDIYKVKPIVWSIKYLENEGIGLKSVATSACFKDEVVAYEVDKQLNICKYRNPTQLKDLFNALKDCTTLDGVKSITDGLKQTKAAVLAAGKGDHSADSSVVVRNPDQWLGRG